jgi:hypothetical protein
VPWPEDAPPWLLEAMAAEDLPEPDWSMYTQWFEVEFQAELEYDGETGILGAYDRDRRSNLLGTAKHQDSWSETLDALHKDMKRMEAARGIIKQDP